MHNAILDDFTTLADERRRHPRIQFSRAVEIVSDNLLQVARLTDLSRNGARLQVAQGVDVGGAITLRRGDVALEGVVAWSRGTAIGLRFLRPLPEQVFLKLRRGAYPTRN